MARWPSRLTLGQLENVKSQERCNNNSVKDPTSVLRYLCRKLYRESAVIMSDVDMSEVSVLNAMLSSRRSVATLTDGEHDTRTDLRFTALHLAPPPAITLQVKDVWKAIKDDASPKA